MICGYGKEDGTVRYKLSEGFHNGGRHLHLSQRYGVKPYSGGFWKILNQPTRNKPQTLF
jgi:hypothetical protein